jgi:general secretion pathway protein D
MEVATTLLQQLGIQWPNQVSASIIGAAGTAGTVTLPEFQNRNSNLFRLTFSDPLFVLNLRAEDGRSNLLANPRIRVKNRDKAKVHIGDRVPVITTTATATGFVAESVTYVDTGLKLEVEPQVFLDNDVGIKVGLEVSNISKEVTTRAGTVAYQIGTRNASTTLRLKDGETQVLAGLISDEDRRSATKVPGLGDLPMLGRIFKSTNDTLNKTEIVLLITPRVLRNLTRPDARLEEFLSGTEATVGEASSAAAGAPPPGITAPVPPPTGMTPPPAPRASVPSAPQAAPLPNGPAAQPPQPPRPAPSVPPPGGPAPGTPPSLLPGAQ